jgi:hypothetical protein
MKVTPKTLVRIYTKLGNGHIRNVDLVIHKVEIISETDT